MKIGVLTSSRADYGIYLPLLKELFKDDFFSVEIIAFGTHLSDKFGRTIKEIENSGFVVKHKINTLVENDQPVSISRSIGKTINMFSNFWEKNKYDLVFALGDRFEMLGAVLSGSVFNMKFAHIHAGETTLGAIDNAYRHSISLMSKYLFVSTDEYKKRAIEIIQRPMDVYDVGALSIDNLKKEVLYNKDEFKNIFKIDLNLPTILTTFHPETVGFEKNEKYIVELINALNKLSKKYQIIITMPNSDTTGLMIRKRIEAFQDENKEIILIESFGMKGYLSCMKYCKMLIGNTSSGFVEAAFFPKWVINIGNRQKGRLETPNILKTSIDEQSILEAVNKIELLKLPSYSNIYGDGNAAKRIITTIKNL